MEGAHFSPPQAGAGGRLRKRHGGGSYATRLCSQCGKRFVRARGVCVCVCVCVCACVSHETHHHTTTTPHHTCAEGELRQYAPPELISRREWAAILAGPALEQEAATDTDAAAGPSGGVDTAGEA